MKHEPLLDAAQISPPLEATSYAEVLDELAAFAARQPGVVDGERFMSQVTSLGADDTIAVGGGAFLPHLKSDAIDREVVVMGITARPLRVPVESGEETRGRLFVLVAAPPDEHAGYLEKVASIAAALRGEDAVDAILEAGEPGRIAALTAIREAPRVQRLSVLDVMDPAAQRVYPDMALPDAARVLIRGRHSALPVVNKRDEIVGMVSEKDLIKAFLPGYLRISGGASGEDGGRESADRTLVRDVMSKAVLCLPVEASINEAASIIVNKNVDPLPLTREGKWVGLISRRSLIRKLLQF
ncbi:MAG TPA: CBS domain-containing protein [Gemmatimonadota bacterium]|nr:CBS domain-containing protein [Gemmatimonadota bacterium]